LHEACIRGSAALIDLLVSAGAPPAARDKFGQTPLDLALAYQNRAAIGALERLSAQRSDCRAAAANAMETATLRGQTEIVRLLIDGGFDLSNRTPAGSTYLHVAALKGQSKLVKLFLDRGADVNALDETGGTPLHSAALGGSTEVINLLLDRGARIDAADRDSGATPLMLAASVSRTEAVALLLQRGAKPGIRDRRGHTALDRARETDDNESVKLLQHISINAVPALKPLV
jgi:cytohesin